MLDGSDDKVDKKVREYQKDSPLAKEMESKDDGRYRSQVFDSAVMDACFAASRLYTNGDTKLDSVIDDLIDWLEKCKGKESELMKEAKKSRDEEEEEKDY